MSKTHELSRAEMARLAKMHAIAMGRHGEGGRVLRPYQREFLTTALTCPQTAWLGARQIGKTYTLGYLALLLAAGIRLPDGTDLPASDVLIVSSDQDKATKIVRSLMADWIKPLRFAADVLDPSLGSLSRVALKNGSYIVALPGYAGKLQGYTGHVLIDELGTSSEAEDLIAQAMAVASSQSHYRVVACSNSTPEGHYVHSLFRGTEVSGWATQETSIWDAYPGGLPPKIQHIRDTLSVAQWSRWYENQFVSGSDPYFDAGLVNSRVGMDADPGGPYLIAWDPGWTSDPSGVVVLSVQDRLSVVLSTKWYGTDEDEQLQRIVDLSRAHGGARVVVDRGGATGLVSRLTRMLGTRKVVPVSVNPRMLTAAAEELDRHLTGAKIDLGSGPVVRDLIRMRRDALDQIDVPREKSSVTRADGAGMHTDHCDAGVALLLAIPHAPLGSGGQRKAFTALPVAGGPRLRF